MRKTTSQCPGHRRNVGLVMPLLALLFHLVFPFDNSSAQVAPITPSGLTTQVNLSPFQPNGKVQYDITGGTRPGGTSGTNLFHSFGNFNVPTTNIANFLNAGSVDVVGNPLAAGLPTTNILGRVTGPNGNNPTLSSIYGTIQTTDFGNANLFLMNPAGFLFGPGATVNVGGMVSFTTADYLRLSDGINNGYFYADPAGPSLLTAAPVAAFGFLGPNAASIAIQGGTLEVPDGKTLSFIGGPRTFTTDTGVIVPAGVTMTGGSLSAPNGLIYMATVTSPGEIQVPTLSGAQLGNLGPPSSDPAVIRIRSGEFVMDHSVLAASNTSDSAQPAIEVSVQGAMTLRNASSIVTNTLGAGNGSNVHIAALSLEADGSSIRSSTSGSGHGGDISITNAQTVNLTNGAQIVSSTEGAGGGGNISISASETVSISGYDATGTLSGVTTGDVFNPAPPFQPLVTSGLFSTASGTGNGGQISIYSPTGQTGTSQAALTVNVENGGTIATINSGDGLGGNISIVNAQSVDLTNGGRLFSSTGQDLTTFDLRGTGTGGDIGVTAKDSILISGSNPDLFIRSGIGSQTYSGNGGNILLSAPTVAIENGAAIGSTTLGSGTGGSITITAPNQLSLSGFDTFGVSSQITTDAEDIGLGSGNSGAISITAGSVSIADSALVQTQSSSSGNAGDLTLQVTNDLNVTNLGVLRSNGTIGSSGNITINADRAFIGGTDGFSASSMVENLNSGGNVASNIGMNVRELVVTDGARINLESTVQGGNITIVAHDSVTISNQAKIRLFNESGIPGTISIDARTINMDQGIIQTQSFSTGDAGGVNLRADNLTLSGSFINSQAPFNAARGGDVTIAVNDKVTIKGQFAGSPTDPNPQAAGIYTITGASGDAGRISISAGMVELLDGARLDSRTSGAGHGGAVTIQGLHSPADSVVIDGAGSGIFTETQGTGAGGNINLFAQSLTLQNGATLSAATSGTAASATGGTIKVNAIVQDGQIMPTAAQSVTLSNGASISTTSTGPANAGDIVINAGQNYTSTNSAVTTQATAPGTEASGGNITVLATDMVLLTNSQINASVQGSSTTVGGNIVIDPQFVILQNSQILAQATHGQGGNISITTNVFLPDSLSIVDASSQTGINGNVNIQSPTSQAGGKIAPLSKTTLETTALLSQRCAALASGQFSSFVVAGRDTLPTEPGGWLGSPLASLSVESGLAAEGDAITRDRLALADDLRTGTLSLRRTPSGGMLSQAFALDWTGCES